jgi:hypothetical protein
MATPTPVNGQITDSISQANVEVLGSSPAMSLGTVYQSLGHSTGILFENAVGAQQQLSIAAHAGANQGVIQIYSVNTMAGASAAAKLAQSGTPDTMMSLMAALKGVESIS